MNRKVAKSVLLVFPTLLAWTAGQTLTNYCETGKCGLCQKSKISQNIGCKICYYSLPVSVGEDLYRCTGNSVPVPNCIAVESNNPNSCIECESNYGSQLKAQIPALS